MIKIVMMAMMILVMVVMTYDDNAHHQDRQAQGAALIDNELLLQSCFPAFQFSGWSNTILFLFFIDGS